jgi:hypothetical protein
VVLFWDAMAVDERSDNAGVLGALLCLGWSPTEFAGS